MRTSEGWADVDDRSTPKTSKPAQLRVNLKALMIAIPLAFVGYFFLYPVGQIFRLSFTDFVTPGATWIENYRWFFGNETQLIILRRTFLVAGMVTGICLALGFPYAYLMTVVSPRTRAVMTAAVLLPFWSNLVVRTYAWVILLGDNGPIRDAISSLGLSPPQLLGNMTGVTIGAIQVLLPFLVLPLYGALKGIDRQLLDAAQSLGARPTAAFTKVYLPLATPGILAGSLIVFIMTLGFYYTPALLGTPRESLISQQVVSQVSTLLAFGRGGAMALILLIATLVLLSTLAWISRRLTKGASNLSDWSGS